MAMSEAKVSVPQIESESVTVARAAAKVPALATIVFGLVVLFCVGFLQVSAVHNGVHDTRHANGFPCH